MIKKCLSIIFAFTTLGAAAALPPMYQVIFKNNSGFFLPAKDTNLLYAQWCDANGNKLTQPWQVNPGNTAVYVCETDPTKGAFSITSDFSLYMDKNNPQIGCSLFTVCHSSYNGQCTGGMQAEATTLSGPNYSGTCPAPVVVQPQGGALGSITVTIGIAQNQK